MHHFKQTDSKVGGANTVVKHHGSKNTRVHYGRFSLRVRVCVSLTYKPCSGGAGEEQEEEEEGSSCPSAASRWMTCGSER